MPEGVEGQVAYKGPAKDVVHQLVGGIKAAMGYTGSATIDDLRTSGANSNVCNMLQTMSQIWTQAGAPGNVYFVGLVDTGASVVAISAVHARQLGIEFDESHQGTVQTAQGTADTHFVTLDEIVVGGITAHNVRAAIIEGEYPLEPLLGMSFLRQVSLQENAGVLTLTKQH